MEEEKDQTKADDLKTTGADKDDKESKVDKDFKDLKDFKNLKDLKDVKGDSARNPGDSAGNPDDSNGRSDEPPAEPDWKDRYARAMADFDNFRKRTARDREDLVKFAAADVLKDILPTVDNLARALDEAKDKADDPFVAGVKLVYDGLIKALADRYRGKIDAVAGLESRGFILAAPLAVELGVGMVTVRKAGRLPGPVVGVDYDLEYGSARMELQPFTVEDGQRVLVIDDVLATGGTANAAFELIKQAGGIPAGLCVLIELDELDGRSALLGYEVDAVYKY